MDSFKELDLEELWTEVHNIVQKVVTKTIPKKKKCKKSKWFPQCVCPAVVLLGRMAVLFPVF